MTQPSAIRAKRVQLSWELSRSIPDPGTRASPRASSLISGWVPQISGWLPHLEMGCKPSRSEEAIPRRWARRRDAVSG
ncbi:hypothetical protein ACFPRL_15140 [Pseudoclavibacter helvolus]